MASCSLIPAGHECLEHDFSLQAWGETGNVTQSRPSDSHLPAEGTENVFLPQQGLVNPEHSRDRARPLGGRSVDLHNCQTAWAHQMCAQSGPPPPTSWCRFKILSFSMVNGFSFRDRPLRSILDGPARGKCGGRTFLGYGIMAPSPFYLLVMLLPLCELSHWVTTAL